MMEFIQVTAQYSNAVLVAILPQISDFATKLELPVPLPITAAQVREFRCAPFKDYTGGVVLFTNHLEVSYMLGHVSGFRTPRSYYNLQDPRDIPRFFGTPKLDKDQALDFARQNIRKLGYNLKETFTDQEPEIDYPPQFGTNMVPHYRFRWTDPLFGNTCVSIEVDAQKNLVHELRLLSLYFHRDPPKIAVTPSLMMPRPAVSATTSNEVFQTALPAISTFSKRLKLPLRLPITPRQIAKVEFVDSGSDVRIRLVSGHWFALQNKTVVEFSAPDTIFGRQPPMLDPSILPFSKYLGKWRMNETEAVALVRQAITALGYNAKDFYLHQTPDVTKPKPVGNYIVPHYSFRWLTNNASIGGTIAAVRAEVDASRKRLVYLSLNGVPLVDTNAMTNLPKHTLSPATNQPAAQSEAEAAAMNDVIKFLEKNMPTVTNPPPTDPKAKYE